MRKKHSRWLWQNDDELQVSTLVDSTLYTGRAKRRLCNSATYPEAPPKTRCCAVETEPQAATTRLLQGVLYENTQFRWKLTVSKVGCGPRTPTGKLYRGKGYQHWMVHPQLLAELVEKYRITCELCWSGTEALMNAFLQVIAHGASCVQERPFVNPSFVLLEILWQLLRVIVTCPELALFVVPKNRQGAAWKELYSFLAAIADEPHSLGRLSFVYLCAHCPACHLGAREENVEDTMLFVLRRERMATSLCMQTQWTLTWATPPTTTLDSRKS